MAVTPKIESETWGENGQRMTVTAYTPDGKEMGRADLDLKEGHIHVAGILTEAPYRRQGVAAAMLAHAEKKTGLKVSFKDTEFTESGKAFSEGLMRKDAEKKATETGPRGGRYYMSSSGEKVYVK